MILQIYAVLIAISLVMIVIGLVKPSESAQALIGFFFLFLLSFVLINEELTIETGSNVSTILTYNGAGQVVTTDQIIKYDYSTFQGGISKKVGRYLAIASAVGFAGVLFSVAKTKWGQE